MFSRLARTITMTLVSLSLISCGTILHPERKGQVSGQIDPAVAILNGLGLLLYFIPGVIAFAVDFSNGTIYLPDGRTTSLSTEDLERLKSGDLDPGALATELSGTPVESHEVHISEVPSSEMLAPYLANAH